MTDRTSRDPLRVVGAVLALLLVALLISWTTGLMTTSPRRSLPAELIKIDGLPTVKIFVNLIFSRAQVAPALGVDISKASELTGLYECAPNPLDTSSMPAPPGFFCSATSGFNASSLAALERLPDVTGVGGGNARRQYESLFFLGVLRGEPALVVQPIGNISRIHADLAALRRLPGVLHCGWSGGRGPMMGPTIACAMSSHAAAIRDEKAARSFTVSYAEVIANW